MKENSDDLIVQLFNAFVESGNPPDILSRQFEYTVEEEEIACIRLEWMNGVYKDYPYSKSRYDAIRKRFNEFWEPLKEGCPTHEIKPISSWNESPQNIIKDIERFGERLESIKKCSFKLLSFKNKVELTET